MITGELQRRGCNAVLVTLHVRKPDFDAVMPPLQQLANLDGLVFAIPFAARALGLASQLGPQAQQVCGRERAEALARRQLGGRDV